MYTVLVAFMTASCGRIICRHSLVATESFRVRVYVRQQPCDTTSADMYQTSSDVPFCLSVCKVTFFNHIYHFFFRKYANFTVQSFAQSDNK